MNSFYSIFSPLKLDGTCVKKNKMLYPYSYDEFVIYKSQDFNIKEDVSVYSDRMLHWDFKKCEEISKLLGYNICNCLNLPTNDPNKIETWLRLYFDEGTLKLTAIVEGCNISNGYSYWIYFYNTNKKESLI